LQTWHGFFDADPFEDVAVFSLTIDELSSLSFREGKRRRDEIGGVDFFPEAANLSTLGGSISRCSWHGSPFFVATDVNDGLTAAADTISKRSFGSVGTSFMPLKLIRSDRHTLFLKKVSPERLGEMRVVRFSRSELPDDNRYESK